jgi:hypothetical protein
MSPENDKKSSLKPLPYVDVVAGSVVTQIAAQGCALVQEYGLDPEIFVQRLHFDWPSKFTCSIDDGLTLEMDACFGPDDFVEARLHTDKAALKKAEERGDLYPVSEAWHENPGAAVENMGAGGESIMGFLLAMLNRRPLRRRLRKIIQKAIAHAGQDRRVIEGMDDGRLPIRLIVKLRFSTVGGMGSGAMHWFLGDDGIRSCAQ